MKQINFKTDVYVYPKMEDFLADFEPKATDCIFTMHLFEQMFEPIKDKTQMVFYDDFAQGEPDNRAVEKIIETLKNKAVSRIVAVGGGSVIDTAKILALKGITEVKDIYLTDIELKKDKELIAVPTTCGTGSEVTNIAVMAFRDTGIKRGKNHDAFFPDKTVLVPQVLQNLPFHIMMTCSIDALAHAAESLISPKATDYTEIFAQKSIENILTAYKMLGKDKLNTQVLELLMQGSNMAGITMSYAGTGIVHALAMGVGEFGLHLPHAEAVYLYFAESMKFYNGKNPGGQMGKLKKIIAGVFGCDENYAIEYLETVLEEFVKPKRLPPVSRDKLYEGADSLLKNQQRLYVNSYVKPSREEIVGILEKCC